MSSPLRILVAGARSAAVGKEHGITPGDLSSIAPLLEASHRSIGKDRRSGKIGFFDLHRDTPAIRASRDAARQYAKLGPRNLVILGIGGSALGTSTLVRALKPPHYNLLSDQQRLGKPRVFVVDNVDPETYHQVLELCDPSETVYNIISKSGGTAETLAQGILAIEQIVGALGKRAVADRVLITSDPPKRGKSQSPLHALGSKYGMNTLTMPANVGGRFSVFTAVGLFPAAMLGIDIGALLRGAGRMARECRRGDVSSNPAYLRAAFQYLAYTRKGKTMSVLMPYADSLSLVSDWYRQLWAESLGKSSDKHGFVGQTPIKALGVTDQHSQLQLYLEGPNDKTITLLEVGKMNRTLPFPAGVLPRGKAAYLKGRTMQDLLNAECKATAGALREAKRPVMRIKLDRVDEESVGQLLYLFEMETAMAAALLGINAYDQPAVERIKVLTRQFLGAMK